MKKILFFILTMVVVCSFTNDEKIKWNSWNEGTEMSKRENKPLFIFVYITWCDQSKRMDEKTLGDKEVVSFIQSNYIPVKIDAEAKDKYKYNGKSYSIKKLAKKMFPDTQLGLPLCIIWTPGEENKQLILGLKDPEEMKEILQKNIKK